MNLPTFEQAETAIKADKADDIDRLVYHNEPAGYADMLQFRTQITAALNMAVELGRMDSQLKFESNNEA